MYYLLIVLLAISSVKIEAKNFRQLTNNDTRIIGGRQIDISRVPFIVAIFYNNEFGCGGSILDSKNILTAAHCAIIEKGDQVKIRAGSSNRQSGGQLRIVKRILINSKYNPNTLDNDIAILQLDTPLTFNQNVKPVRLASNYRPRSGIGFVAGWGITREGQENSPVYLRGVSVNFITLTECKAQYKPQNLLVTRNMVCAGADNGGKDACQGDSGGPLISNGAQYGIVSSGLRCGQAGYSGVYTSISRELSWIRNVLSKYS
ncbi:trypsin-2-like [Episyrphus balteatus]|uniref:trypsin-2-like n=1 Tax=Episyrphus balteatus TaxID=286459 RepID=UPI0024863511|nr:trypsin-2-like [Episyrphus balteatus]